MASADIGRKNIHAPWYKVSVSIQVYSLKSMYIFYMDKEVFRLIKWTDKWYLWMYLKNVNFEFVVN